MAGVRRHVVPTSSAGPAKRFKGDGGQVAPTVAVAEPLEVRYSAAHEAEAALSYHGCSIQGLTLSVKLDETSKDRTKIIVTGLPADMECEEVKAQFSGAGTVLFAGPPKQPGFRAFAGGAATGVGEVRYETPQEAMQAVGLLDGSILEGATITATLDQTSKDSSKLLITGLPASLQWQELKDYCAQAGRVAYCNVKMGGGGGFFSNDSMEAEVRYDAPEHTQLALQHLNGTVLGGQQISIRADPNSKDHTRLLVSGFPASIQWQELKDHFSSVGVVAFAQVKGPAGGKAPALGAGKDTPFVPWGGKAPMAMPGKGACGKVVPGIYARPAMMGGGKNMYYDAWPSQGGGGAWGGVRPGMPAAGKGAVNGSGSGEVRYDSPAHARIAIAKLNGTFLQGSKISVSQDASSQDGSKVVVHGIPGGIQWQELKDHFGQIGQVAFASILGPGEVRMETPEEAQEAVSMLHGAEVLGSVISVTMDRSSKDGTRLLVNDLPSSVNWQQLKDIFSQAGTVAFATRQEAR